eukprot:1657605-Pleurochrysis_carterae.AAC.3
MAACAGDARSCATARGSCACWRSSSRWPISARIAVSAFQRARARTQALGKTMMAFTVGRELLLVGCRRRSSRTLRSSC